MSISISEASRNLSHWVNQASYGRECVLLTSRGRVKAVVASTFDRFGTESLRVPVDLSRAGLAR